MTEIKRIHTRGDYRVILVSDDDNYEPEDDCEPPLLRIERGGLEFRRKTYGTDEKVREAFDRWTSRPGDAGWRYFEKYLRAYLGVKVLQVWRSDDVAYVAYDCPAWREYVGLEPADDVSERDLFGEWKAYVEGDVWGYKVQKRVTWNTEDGDYDDRSTWEDTEDTCWSLYGYDYAEQEARGALADYESAPVAT